MRPIRASTRILDRQEITDLLIEYCRALDLMDLAGHRPGLHRGLPRSNTGRRNACASHGAAGVAKSLERMWRWARTSHHLSNIQIAFEGADAARADQLCPGLA